MPRPLFYMLDGHALAYRHYYANTGRPFVTTTGIVTSAAYGFTRTLVDVLEKERPLYMAVAFDEGLSGREEYFPDYKAHREAAPPDFESQMPIIREIVQAFGLRLLTDGGKEADDLIGTVSRCAVEHGADVVIYSGDRDLLQLLDNHTHVRLYIPQAGVPDEMWDSAHFRERYGLEPLQLIDLKALEGDTSDNIPGVAGIGRKGATALLQQFGSIEAIYAGLDQIRQSTRSKLEAGRESATVSKRLATIHRDLPLPFSLEAYRVGEPDREALIALLRKLEFNSILRQFEKSAAAPTGRPAAPQQISMFSEALPSPPVPETPALYPTIIVDSADALHALMLALRSAKRIAFDTETTGTDPLRADLVGISLSIDGQTGYYLPLGHREGVQLSIEEALAALRPALTDPAIPKAAHNADFDALVLHQYGLEVTPIAFDTMIAEWMRDPLSQYLGLKRLAGRDLHVIMTEISELIGTGKTQITMDAVPIAQAAPYAAADAVVTHQLVDKLEGDLEHIAAQRPDVDPLWHTPAPPTVLDVYREIEIPLVPVLMRMEEAGVLVDTAFLATMSQRLQKMCRALEEEIYSLSEGGAFNINSPRQLNDVLYGRLGLRAEGVRKTTHGFSTAADVLDGLRGEHPIIDRILNYRELTKLRGTYVDALPALIHPRTGRLHTSFNQTGTSTGRLSSSNPNLQNIPIRTETGREVRAAFIARPGWKLLSVDYSQIELRVMAHVTREPTLLDAFQRGQDIHAATAAIVYRIPVEQVTKTQRIFAKRVNFGILYGMGAFRLARDSDLTLAEAQHFIDEYFARLPGVRSYLDQAKRLAYETGALTTLFGRRRTFPALHGSGNRNLRAAAEREAINMPIQGTAADIVKRAMIRLDDALRQRRSPARMLLQVHDELVLEVPDEALHETTALVVQVMESAAELAAPLRANAAWGDNWRDLTDAG
jgi:DNA polymerase-1